MVRSIPVLPALYRFPKRNTFEVDAEERPDRDLCGNHDVFAIMKEAIDNKRSIGNLDHHSNARTNFRTNIVLGRKSRTIMIVAEYINATALPGDPEAFVTAVFKFFAQDRAYDRALLIRPSSAKHFR
jgi:hypothetical protein